MATLSTIGLDADDTLWQSEQFFKLTEARFVELLADHAEGADLSARLLQADRAVGRDFEQLLRSLPGRLVVLVAKRKLGHEV